MPPVRVWAVDLQTTESSLARCLAWLDAGEKERAGRFHFDEHRQAFILGRGVLRALLGRFLEAPAAEIQFVYGPKGKPALANSSSPLRFNVSNTGRLAVYAFTEDCELGIDVERIHPIPQMEDIAARFFSAAEAAELSELPESDRPQAFFNCWTRKEAYIKAVGDGLSVPLDSFRVTLRPGAAARMLCLDGSVEAAQGWTLQDFRPGPDAVGALAYPGRPRPLVLRPLVAAEELLDTL
jgi:4'-phosphopantetheinyl transferase